MPLVPPRFRRLCHTKVLNTLWKLACKHQSFCLVGYSYKDVISLLILLPLQETGVFTESVMLVAHSKKDLPSSEVVYPGKPFHHEGRFNWVEAICCWLIVC